jgi:hypothetical protein
VNSCGKDTFGYARRMSPSNNGYCKVWVLIYAVILFLLNSREKYTTKDRVYELQKRNLWSDK